MECGETSSKTVCFPYFLPMKFSQKIGKNMFSEIWLILEDLVINQCKTTQMCIFLSFWVFPCVRNVLKIQKKAKNSFFTRVYVKHVCNMGYEVFKIDFTYKKDFSQVLFVGGVLTRSSCDSNALINYVPYSPMRKM